MASAPPGLGSGFPAPSEDPDGDPLAYVKAAFLWQYNLIGIAGAGLFALLSASALPLVLAAGAELVFLSTLPHTGQFRRLVRSWRYADEKKRLDAARAALLRELPPELRKRYEGLNTVCMDIRRNYARLSSTSQIFIRQTETTLGGLLQAYTRLLNSADQHAKYIETTHDADIRREVAQLQKGLESDAPRVQEINRKRVEILQKRLDKLDAIQKNREVIDAQCAALEDVLQLIRDQSVTITDPQQISGQLESLMHDVEQTEQAVRQVESIYEITSADSLDLSSPMPADSSTSPARQRTRS